MVSWCLMAYQPVRDLRAKLYIYIFMKVNMDKIRQYEGSRKKYNPNR